MGVSAMKRLAIASLVVFAAAAVAERPPQFRKGAEVIVTGTVEKLTTAEKEFAGEGVTTTYTATVKVSEVKKGDVKAGDTIDVTWFHVTKRPTKPVAGAFGQDHGLKEKDEATFWLMGSTPPYAVIYNRDGVEKVKK